MHRTTKSINPGQEDELSNIDTQLDHVNKALKWSILDLEKFAHSLKARLIAEEAYVSALQKIIRHTEIQTNNTTNTDNYFEDTNFSQTTQHYENSIEKTIESRRELISCLKSQIEILLKVKDSHEQRRKKVKAVLGEKNMNYILFRTRDIIKLQKNYFNKCTEYASLQQQILISSHEDNPTNEPHYLSPMMARISSDEARKSSDSNSRESDTHSLLSQQDNNSISPSNYKKSSMAGFITTMRSQLANAAAVDPSKQAARLAKLKKEINDSDNEYRQGIRILEFLRKKQAETAIHAMRHVEAILIGKSDAVKAVMVSICKQEEDTLLNEVDMIRHSLDTIYNMDSKRDTDQFLIEYEKLGYSKPKPVYYENYYYGRCKEILFGSNLNDYCLEHNRTVPLLVTKCIQELESLGGLEKEGIYRISGRQSNVDALKSEFEKDEQLVVLDSKYDVFTIASVLKIYLRELKQPLFNLTMQDRIDYSNITDDVKRKTLLQTRISELSKPQRDTLEAVITHLAKVKDHSHINKMTIKNLSVIFTPALFHDHNQAENVGEWYSDKVLEDLIYLHQDIFINAENQNRILQEQRKLQQQPGSNLMDSPSASVMSLPFSAVGIQSAVSRQASIRTVKKPSSTTNHHTSLIN